MPISEKTRKAMERVGLTSYEIKSFAVLLEADQLTASDISQESGVPYSKIYEVLGALQEKGWVDSDGGRPTKYLAKSPATGLQTTRHRREGAFADDQNIILNELGPLYEKSGKSEKPDIWVLTGGINIASKMLEMVESCRHEVMIAIPEAGQALVSQALPKLRSLKDKGVDVVVLTSDKMGKDSLKAISRVARVKIKKGLFGGGVISDKRYVVILLGPEVGSETADTVAIWADHAGLAGFARQYFEYLLKDSKKV